MNKSEEYETYGEEWVKEMKKLPKALLICFLKKAYIDKAKLLKQLECDKKSL